MNQAYREELEAAVSRGEIPRQCVEAQLAHLRRRSEVREVRLGGESAAWDQFVHFILRLSRTNEESLSWPLRLVAIPPSKTVVLDAESTTQLDYALEPSAASQIAPAEYQIIATLEVPTEAKLPADRWRGRVESEPVKLSITEMPSRLAGADEEKLDLDFATCYHTVSNLSEALGYAQKDLVSNPNSIPAYILVGGIKEPKATLEGP